MKLRLSLTLLAFFVTFPVVNSGAQLPKHVGKDACAKCHLYEQRTVIATPHDASRSCEGCHGAGEKHLREGGGADSIFSYRRATAEEVRARCGECHHNPVMAKHAEGDVACTACHSSHHYVHKKYLLKPEDLESNPG